MFAVYPQILAAIDSVVRCKKVAGIEVDWVDPVILDKLLDRHHQEAFNLQAFEVGLLSRI
jgi:hypothetical protein